MTTTSTVRSAARTTPARSADDARVAPASARLNSRIPLVPAGGAPPSAPPSARPVISDPDGVPVAFGWTDGADHWLEVPDAGTFRFRPGGDRILSYAHPRGSHDQLLDAFWTMTLPLALHVSGFEALHASAVRVSQGVAVFCAQSGTGKSTIAYALSRRGHALWADDAVVLEAQASGGVAVHSLPFRANIRPQTGVRYSLDAGAPPVDGGGRAPAPLRAVFLLERVDGGPVAEITRLPRAHALPALLPHAFRFDLTEPARRRETVSNYLEVVASAPVYELRFVPSWSVIDALLDEVERALEERA